VDPIPSGPSPGSEATSPRKFGSISVPHRQHHARVLCVGRSYVMRPASPTTQVALAQAVSSLVKVGSRINRPIWVCRNARGVNSIRGFRGRFGVTRRRGSFPFGPRMVETNPRVMGTYVALCQHTA
jgi:hypothetical protein